MILKNFSLENRGILLLVFCLISLTGTSQMKPEKNPLESFLDTQFWLGLRLGMNYTQAFPEARNSGISAINYSADDLRKSYEKFTLPGVQMGLEMNFYYRGFSVSLQPTFKRSRYAYTSEFEWIGTLPNERFETKYEAEQRLDLLEFPLMLKGDLIRKGKIRPFLMAGGYYTVIATAQKDVDVTQTDFTSGSARSSSQGTISIGVKDAFKNYYGIAGGAGVNLDYWNVRAVVEVVYQHSLSSAAKSNVLQNELASIGEINDEVEMRNIGISISFVFPFRFIDHQFKTI